MAARGSSKYLSVQQEDYIARIFGGKRSKSSGAAEHDAGDVRTGSLLIECKMTRNSHPKLIGQFEKIAQEAWEEAREPMLAFRYYAPGSKLAGPDGWVDFALMLATDMANRL